MTEQKIINAENVKNTFMKELEKNNIDYYGRPKTLWFNFMGLILGLKIARSITQKEYKELEKFITDKLVVKERTCFTWLWQKPHKHTKACYEKRFKTWSELRK